jgi:hypothetical protein
MKREREKNLETSRKKVIVRGGVGQSSSGALSTS